MWKRVRRDLYYCTGTIWSSIVVMFSLQWHTAWEYCISTLLLYVPTCMLLYTWCVNLALCWATVLTHISMVNILYIKWNSFSPTWESPLTCDDDQSCETGEGRNIKLHAVQTSRKLQDGVDPIPKTSDALVFVKHWPVAEDELVCFRTGPLVLKKKGKRSDCSTGQNIVVL